MSSPRARRLAGSVALAALVLSAVPVPGRAADPTGADLLRLCKGSAEQQRRCQSTLKDLIAAIGDSIRYCLPAEFDLTQVRLAYVAWGAEEPDELGQPQRAAVEAALLEQFPCEQ